MIMQEQFEEVLLIMAEKGIIPYKDGNQWCILLGENIQEGVCGFGYTIIDAMMDFYREATAEGIIQKKEQKFMKDKIIEDTISYLNGGMCFSNSMEELKYRSNLAYGLKSLRPQPHWKPSEAQMEALLNAEKYLNAGLQYGSARRIAELIEQIKKQGVKEEPEYYQHFDPDC